MDTDGCHLVYLQLFMSGVLYVVQPLSFLTNFICFMKNP